MLKDELHDVVFGADVMPDDKGDVITLLVWPLMDLVQCQVRDRGIPSFVLLA
jgi:hypothetical protein